MYHGLQSLWWQGSNFGLGGIARYKGCTAFFSMRLAVLAAWQKERGLPQQIYSVFMVNQNPTL